MYSNWKKKKKKPVFLFFLFVGEEPMKYPSKGLFNCISFHILSFEIFVFKASLRAVKLWRTWTRGTVSPILTHDPCHKFAFSEDFHRQHQWLLASKLNTATVALFGWSWMIYFHIVQVSDVLWALSRTIVTKMDDSVSTVANYKLGVGKYIFQFLSIQKSS